MSDRTIRTVDGVVGRGHEAKVDVIVQALELGHSKYNTKHCTFSDRDKKVIKVETGQQTMAVFL